MSETTLEIRIKKLRKETETFPDVPGVYLFKNQLGVVLYVGKAVSLRKRIVSYFGVRSVENLKIRSLVSQTDHLEFILTEGENQALLLESNLIKRHRPRYNVVLRDDKSYPYLKLTLNEDFPRILISRRPTGDGARYYGPYPNLKLRDLVKLIYRYFNIRDCDIEIDGKLERACLSYQIHQCPAPCVGFLQKEEYGKLVKRLQWFLEGKHEELIAHVETEMAQSSEKQEYEEAAKSRDLLATIRQIQSHYSVIGQEKVDADVISMAEGFGKVLISMLQVRQGKVVEHIRLSVQNGLDQPLQEVLPLFMGQFYLPGIFIPEEIILPETLREPSGVADWLSQQKGFPVKISHSGTGWRRDLGEMAEKNALAALKEDIQQTSILKELREALSLLEVPRTIACFDISNLQGTFNVGSAVFFQDGTPEKSRYRKFKIREVTGQDDYRSHQEMMRRYLRLLEREGNPIPDLFLIDGGKGQLRAVEVVLKEELVSGFGLAALAKREEQVFIPGLETPVDFKGKAKVLHLLQRVRDESHRFAVGYHRFLRDRENITSLLRRVKGIGPRRLRILLNRFGSIKDIEKAPLEDLSAVPGISRELANQLFTHLHP